MRLNTILWSFCRIVLMNLPAGEASSCYGIDFVFISGEHVKRVSDVALDGCRKVKVVLNKSQQK